MSGYNEHLLKVLSSSEVLWGKYNFVAVLAPQAFVGKFPLLNTNKLRSDFHPNDRQLILFLACRAHNFHGTYLKPIN